MGSGFCSNGVNVLLFHHMGLLLLYLSTSLITPLPSELLFHNNPVSIFSGEKVIKTLAQAYPKKVTSFGEEEGEWWINVGSKKFAYAQGRLLPWDLKAQWEEWDKQDYYIYPPPLIDPNSWNNSLIIRAEATFTQRWDSKIKRYPEFSDSLWQINSRRTAEARMVYVRFQGFRVRVHQDLQPIILRLNTQVQSLREQSPGVAAYFRSLKTIDGFNWRPVAGTSSRSLHSYGAALDLVPKTYNGKSAYWRWSYNDTQPWFLDAWNSRYLPPEALVKVFEDHGFVWGGRWFLFDTMHFEYRPELFLLK